MLSSKDIQDTLERTEIMYKGFAKFKPRQDRALRKMIIEATEARLGLKKEGV